MGRGSLTRSVADSIDAPVEAMPWIPEVFAGLSALGSSPGIVARWLREAGVGEGWSVLDLGCGKGAVALALAAKLGCRAVGVDGMDAFVRAGAEAAAARGLARLCHFEGGDVRVGQRGAGRSRVSGRGWRPGCPWRSGGFDGAMMLGLFDLEEAAGLLRPLVRPGGLYVIDDCVSVTRGTVADDAPLTRAEARLMLEEHGDRVLRERVWRPEQVRRSEARLLGEIRKRVRAVVRREPAARGPMREFLRRQRQAAEGLVGEVRPAMWLVRKRGSGGGR